LRERPLVRSVGQRFLVSLQSAENAQTDNAGCANAASVEPWFTTRGYSTKVCQ
jgi:hypothetical protein